MTPPFRGIRTSTKAGAIHTSDPTRSTIPISAAAVRADPLAAWDALGPGTRRMLTARIVLLGAESTGTTTLAAALADRLRTRGGPWAGTRLVEEYGRTLTERKQAQATTPDAGAPLSVTWTPADFSEIVTVQAWAEEQAAATGGPALICDTDAFATPIWERR
jgi:nicotinamide riboside kinase